MSSISSQRKRKKKIFPQIQLPTRLFLGCSECQKTSHSDFVMLGLGWVKARVVIKLQDPFCSHCKPQHTYAGT